MLRSIVSICLFLVLSGVQAQKVNLKKLDKYIENAVEQWGVPGLSVAIVKDGEIVFEKGYGVKELGKPDKNDEHTLYAIASNTKAFTSAMIAQLVEEGEIQWDDPVQQYIPYFEVYDPTISGMITIRDLLSHRVGLGTFHGDTGWYRSDFTSEEIIKNIKHVKKSYPFRSGYGYSNLMFITAGKVIEEVTGKSWAENVQERILDPVGMTRTVPSVSMLAQKGNYATPHKYRDGKHSVTPWVSWDNVQATGGLLSSVHDMGLWIAANLNHGIIEKDTLFSKTSRNQMWRPHTTMTRNHVGKNDFGNRWAGYGLGWFLGDYQGKYMVRHGGGYDGMISTVNLLPDLNLGVVVLTNGVKVPTSAIAYYVFDRYLGRKEKDWSNFFKVNSDRYYASDTRISDLKAKRVEETKPSLTTEAISGTYMPKGHGPIKVYEKNGAIILDFTRAQDLKARLEHWHYDTYKIIWEKDQPWFSFGTVQFTTDNNHQVKGIKFEVPNDDFFFEELNATKK
ncbi:serine hydrolase [Spongiivirga sp. MCCC 1A20706]|uniref:serine hydrolase n=1 Tax=Spongiivirga sp. MCCC 1A20706 TaxID=3160963 RepID=UPI003977DDFB